MRGIRFVLVACVLVGVLSGNLPGQRREGNLKVGDTAPDFAIKDVDGKKTVRLSDLKGKPVVLIFGSCT